MVARMESRLMTMPVSRRMVVAGIAAGMATHAAGAGCVARGGSMSAFAYVGCRTSRERNAKGDGISVYRVGADGAWSRVQQVRKQDKPTRQANERTRHNHNTVHGDGSEASAFRIDPASGELTF